MKVFSINQLPPRHSCKICEQEKSVEEMVVVRLKKENSYYLRPRCKSCHNEKERGHRREYKRTYLRRWREKNKAVNESYWKNDRVRERCRINANKRFNEKHDAILIQGRLRRRGLNISIHEAEKLLNRFGRCYPSRLGLTPEGLKECERIRSALRRGNGKLRMTALEIRMMVYDEGMFIKPRKQPVPFQHSSKHLREWQQEQRAKKKQ